jgi:ABC-type transporter Mla subunit MlaD
MAIPFRIRHAEWLAGALVLATVAIVIAALVLLGRAHRSFQDRTAYVVAMDDGHGIAAHGPVKMLGVVIGSIEAVEIGDDNVVRAHLEIDPRYAAHVTEGTVARVQASLALETMLGGMALVLVPPAPGSPRLEPGREIPFVAPTDVMDLLPGSGAPPVLDDLGALVRNLRTLSDDLVAPQSDLRRALADTAAVLAEIRGGKGSAGRILADDGALYDRLLATLDGIESAVAGMGGTIDKAGRTMAKVDKLMGTGTDLLEDTRSAVGSSKKVLDGAGELVGDMSPVLDDAGQAMKDLDTAVAAFAEVTAQLAELLTKMDKVVVDMAAITKATKKVWPIRRHIDR